MNALFVAVLVCIASVVYAAPSGHGFGAVISGPSGIVTGAGPIGPAGHGWGPAVGGWGPAVGGWGPAVGGWGLGHGVALAAPAVVAAPVAAPLDYGLAHGHGVAAITAGGGSISASGHGAAIRGPPTAPVVVAGPAGKVAADGLWGPTANIGGHGALGAVGHVGIGHGGHGWW